jgi:hypothetical protein
VNTECFCIYCFIVCFLTFLKTFVRHIGYIRVVLKEIILKNVRVDEFSGSHGDEYEDDCFLECCAV